MSISSIEQKLDALQALQDDSKTQIVKIHQLALALEDQNADLRECRDDAVAELTAARADLGLLHAERDRLKAEVERLRGALQRILGEIHCGETPKRICNAIYTIARGALEEG